MSEIKILGIAPKDVYITFEISSKKAAALLLGLEMAEIKYDGDDEDQSKAQAAVVSFYEELRKGVAAVQNGS